MSRRYLSLVVALLTASLLSASGRAQSATADGYQALVRLHQEFAAFRQPKTTGGVPDYTAAAMDAQRRGLDGFRQRLAAIDPEGWPVAQKIDYLLVRRGLDDLEFRHRVRAWERDPGFYIDLVFRLAYLNLPIPAPRLTDFETRLKAIPKILEQATINLTRGSAEFARLALVRLDKFHDEFLATGFIPLSLIRWEMTGRDDEVKGIWEDVKGERGRLGR